MYENFCRILKPVAKSGVYDKSKVVRLVVEPLLEIRKPVWKHLKNIYIYIYIIKASLKNYLISQKNSICINIVCIGKQTKTVQIAYRRLKKSASSYIVIVIEIPIPVVTSNRQRI